jgi:magnesium-protoporphyrin IX monomethyl ester (oxidative) cyclase
VAYLDSVIEGISQQFYFDDDTDCYGLTYDQIQSRVAGFAPDLVGIGCTFTAQFAQAVEIANRIKQLDSGIPIVMGGNHPSLNAATALQNHSIDIVFRGEAELLFPSLAEKILEKDTLDDFPCIAYRDNGRVVIREEIARIDDLDQLPEFDWDLIPLADYWEKALPQNPFARSRKAIPYETSRGCPEKCIFCSTAKFFGHKWRPKSAERVVSEIRKAVTRYGVEEVEFMDDNLALNYQRFKEICNGLIGANLHLCAPSGIRFDYIRDNAAVKDLFKTMQAAGFYQLTFAVESGNPHVLNRIIGKRLNLDRMFKFVKMAKETGFKTHAFFIVGFPGETRSQIQDTLNYAKRLEIDSCSISVAVPFPATELHRWCEQEGYLSDNFSETQLLLGKSVIKRFDDLSVKELENLVESAAAQLNASKKQP